MKLADDKILFANHPPEETWSSAPTWRHGALIDVEKKWKRARLWSEKLLSFNFCSHEILNFQGKGIGSELLDRLRSWCSRNGVTEVFGSVTTDDLVKTPGLLEWYAERGFAAHSPSEGCLEGSVAMVIWRDSSNQEPPAR